MYRIRLGFQLGMLYWRARPTALGSNEEPTPTEPSDAARRIIDLLTDRQAEEITLLDISEVASFADYFIIATATNARQMRAVVATLTKELRGDGVRPRHQEGESDSGWVLLDYGSIIVHLFSPELRDRYNLEELWREAKQVVRLQ